MLIPLFGTGTQGQAEVLSAQRRVNCYVELPKDPEKSQVTVLSMPGMTQIYDLDDYVTYIPSSSGVLAGPIRAMANITAASANNSAYVAVVRGGWVWQLALVGGLAGTRAGEYVSGSGFMTGGDEDYATEPRVDICDVSGGMMITTGNGVGSMALPGQGFSLGGNHFYQAAIQAATTPEDPSSCVQLGNRIVVSIPSQKYFRYSEDIVWPVSWDALDFTTPESYPDTTIRVWANRGSLIAFGESSTEFFGLSGDPDAPYAPIRGASQPVGLAAKWSVASVAGDVVFLGKGPNGSHQVYRISGYSVSVVSDQQIDDVFNAFDTITDATALSYSVGGHTFYQINFPTEDKSYALDITTGVWSQMVGPDGGRHPAEFAVTWRNKTLIAHHTDPVIYELDTDVHTFSGDEMPREIVTRHFFKDFDRVIVDELTIDFDVGLGSEAGSDPQVMLQISKDNGKSWGTELWQSLGKIGETRKRVVWRRLGQGRDWTFKLRVTDDVDFVIAGAALIATPVVG